MKGAHFPVLMLAVRSSGCRWKESEEERSSFKENTPVPAPRVWSIVASNVRLLVVSHLISPAL